MKISVIITSYNQKAYLFKTIDSVLGQTFMPHEIIICDDGSTDGSRELITAFKLQHPTLIKAVYQEKNLGVTQNRNSGIRMATGDYITTLDGDDLYSPQKLEKEAFRAIETGMPLVYSNVRYIDAKGKENGARYKAGKMRQGCLFTDIATLKYPAPREVLIQRSCIEKIGVQDESFPINEDFEWMVRLAARFPFAAVDAPLVAHRIHAGGLSQSSRLLLLETQAQMAQKMIPHVDKSIEKDKKLTRQKLRAFLDLTRARIAEHNGDIKLAEKHLSSAIGNDIFRSANYDLYIRLMFPTLFKRKSRLPDPLMIGPLALPFYFARGVMIK